MISELKLKQEQKQRNIARSLIDIKDFVAAFSGKVALEKVAAEYGLRLDSPSTRLVKMHRVLRPRDVIAKCI